MKVVTSFIVGILDVQQHQNALAEKSLMHPQSTANP